DSTLLHTFRALDSGKRYRAGRIGRGGASRRPKEGGQKRRERSQSAGTPEAGRRGRQWPRGGWQPVLRGSGEGQGHSAELWSRSLAWPQIGRHRRQEEGGGQLGVRT